jgi:SpoVK/Ycf46/Vps4 family AAA+-type ATPase
MVGIGILIILYYRLAKLRSFTHLAAAVKAIPMMVTPKGRADLSHPGRSRAQREERDYQLAQERYKLRHPSSMPISTGGEAVPGGARGRFDVIPAGEMEGFESIGGMEALKGELRETVGLVLRYPIEAAALKVEHGGVLMYGLPGVGKSAFARAIAGEFHLNALLLNAGNLSTEGLLGVAAQKVGEAFELAKGNLPCLVFIDELETVAGSRNAQNADKAAVGAFLTQLDDAVKVNGLVVVGATNYLERVDEAVRRPGRFDLRVEIKLPDAKGREAILRAKLQGRACGENIELGSLVAATEGWSGAKIEVIIKRAAMSALARVETGGSPVILQSDLELGLQKAREFQESDVDDPGDDFWQAVTGGVPQVT